MRIYDYMLKIDPILKVQNSKQLNTISEEKAQKINELHQAGYSTKQICKELNTCNLTVRRYITR